MSIFPNNGHVADCANVDLIVAPDAIWVLCSWTGC